MKNKTPVPQSRTKNRKTTTKKPTVQVSIAFTFTIGVTLTFLLFSRETIIISPTSVFQSDSNHHIAESSRPAFSEIIQPKSEGIQAVLERILDKTAEINRLNQIIHGLPVLPLEMRRPTSIKMKGPADVPIEEQQREYEKSLDQELNRLQTIINARNAENG
jgi:hypothetical protein